MEILRKISHTIVVGLLGFVLALGIALVTVSLVLTNSETIKSWPVEAGVYTNLTEQFLNATDRPPQKGEELNEEESLQNVFGESPLDRERLEKAVGSVYTADYWQGKFETLIDSFYGWLDGSRENLEFEVAFNDKNAELANALEAELSEQLADYPTCPGSISLENYDPLEASCLPPGVSAQEAAGEFTDDIRDEDFLAGATLSGDDVELDEEFERNGPTIYSVLDRLPWIFLSIAAVLVILAVFSAKSRLRGARKTGQLLFGIGLVSWLGFFIVNRIGSGFELVSDPNNANEEVFAELGQPLIKVAFDDLTTTGLWVALFVVLTGSLMWLGAFIWHKVHHESDAETARASSSKTRNDSKLPKPVKPGKPDKDVQSS